MEELGACTAYPLLELFIVCVNVLREQLPVRRMWNAEDIYFSVRRLDLHRVIKDGDSDTWNDGAILRLNREGQSGLITVIRGALVPDLRVGLHWGEHAKGNPHRGITLLKLRVTEKNI